ncbi:MAG: DUF3443 family protein [Deltaproteobacteria bacterium]|nr:DUF3443 family protein [Deltaproteobacteria bacterium]
MKLNKLLFIILISLMIISCGGGGGGGGTTSTPTVTLVSIVVTPASLSIVPGTTGQFIATGTYSDSSTRNITTSVTWSSLQSEFATINASGLATAVAEGTTTITATSGSVSGTATMKVVIIKSFVITPINPNIDLGATQQFIATCTYSDDTSQDVTTSATWNSSDTKVATISNSIGSKGLSVSLATGTTTITANWGGTNNTSQLTITSTPVANIIPITVNGSLCSSDSYPNKPCVSVTICSPIDATCKTINDILLDTGASGLHIFKSVLTGISLPQIASGSGSLTNCTQFADGSAQWGPVQTADVILGGEPAVRVPLQIIDSSFGTTSQQIKSLCGTPDTTPEKTGFNGILGAGILAEDCGSGCINSASNGRYYSCSDSICTGTKVLLTDQITNPVSLLPVDNNGVLLRLPSIPLGGVVSVNGVLILGIGTQPNNTPSGVTTYHANSDLNFTTVFNGVSYSESFIDSGSNGLFFDARRMSTLPKWGDWFSPSSTQNLSAITKDYQGSPSSTVPFQIGDAEVLLSSSNPNNVFIELGGQYDNAFDWGLPFFLGRSVYVGIEGKTSSLGTGPYWAY